MEIQEFTHKLRTTNKLLNIRPCISILWVLSLAITLISIAGIIPASIINPNYLFKIAITLNLGLCTLDKMILSKSEIYIRNHIKPNIIKNKNLLYLFLVTQNPKHKDHLSINFKKLSKSLKKEVLDTYSEKTLRRFPDYDLIHQDKDFLDILLNEYLSQYHHQIFNNLNKDNFLHFYQNKPQNQEKISEFLKGTLKKTIA